MSAPETRSLAQKRELGVAKALQQVSEDRPSYVGHFKAAFCGEASPRRAIKAMCLQCCGLDRTAVTECSSWSCPLWEYRPYQKRFGEDSE